MNHQGPKLHNDHYAYLIGLLTYAGGFFVVNAQGSRRYGSRIKANISDAPEPSPSVLVPTEMPTALTGYKDLMIIYVHILTPLQASLAALIDTSKETATDWHA